VSREGAAMTEPTPSPLNNVITIDDDRVKNHLDGPWFLAPAPYSYRKDFSCWGQMPKVGTPEYDTWVKEARKFGKAIWDITGKHDIDIVFTGRGDVPGLLPGGEARRHGGVLY
jgi:hypothetical protein